MSNILSNITKNNDYYIKDSFQFKNFINTIEIPENFKLISLDVVYLYTNIPNSLIKTIINKKWDELKKFTKLTKKDVIEAIFLILDNNYFQFKDKFYKQIDGCAMGSPIALTIAQMVMEYLEENVIKNLNIPILFFKRYVDDCLLAVPNNNINDILQAFNNFHKKIQFTLEIESNNKINFLDLTLIKNIETKKIETMWYTKETWSGRYLNYYLHHSISQKRNVVINLIDRGLFLTTPKYRPKILEKIKHTIK